MTRRRSSDCPSYANMASPRTKQRARCRINATIVLLLCVFCTAWDASAVETGTTGAATPEVTPAPSPTPPPPPVPQEEAPPTTTCGDGRQEGTEACEDGNSVRVMCASVLRMRRRIRDLSCKRCSLNVVLPCSRGIARMPHRSCNAHAHAMHMRNACMPHRSCNAHAQCACALHACRTAQLQHVSGRTSWCG